MSAYAKIKKIENPLKLCHFVTHAEVQSAKKNAYTRLSLSLSSTGGESKRRGQGELALGWCYSAEVSRNVFLVT